jgi:hypothetical protein
MKAFPKTLKIKMTREDLVKGKPGRVCLCPIARATKRALKETGLNRVSVVVCNNIVVNDKYRAWMPASAGAFIDRYDRSTKYERQRILKVLKPFTLKFMKVEV